MAFLRVIGSIVCGLIALGSAVGGVLSFLRCYTPPGGYTYVGTQVRIRTLDGQMNWLKLILGILLLGVAIGAFIGAWNLWP